MDAYQRLCERTSRWTDELRALTFEQLLAVKPTTEPIKVGWWRGFVDPDIERLAPNTVRVVVQGVLRLPVLPNYMVAIAGFRRLRDGSEIPLTQQDEWEFDSMNSSIASATCCTFPWSRRPTRRSVCAMIFRWIKKPSTASPTPPVAPGEPPVRPLQCAA